MLVHLAHKNSLLLCLLGKNDYQHINNQLRTRFPEGRIFLLTFLLIQSNIFLSWCNSQPDDGDITFP